MEKNTYQILFWILFWLICLLVFIVFQYGGLAGMTAIAPNSWQSYSLFAVVVLVLILGFLDIKDRNRNS